MLLAPPTTANAADMALLKGVNELTVHQAINHYAMIFMLSDLGIITQEDWEAARLKATQHVDQLASEARDAIIEWMIENHKAA